LSDDQDLEVRITVADILQRFWRVNDYWICEKIIIFIT
jgi:hypothetical protein